MSVKQIIINPSASTTASAVVSEVNRAPANFPELVFGDSYSFVVKFTGNTNDGYIVPDLNSQYLFNIGALTRATAGTFEIAYDGEYTEALSFNASADEIATALNSLSKIASAGGVNVSGSTGSPYRIIFKTNGVRGKFEVRSNLYPDTNPIIYVVNSGDANSVCELLIVLKLDTIASVSNYVVNASAKELRFDVSLNTVECLLALGTSDKVRLLAELKSIDANGNVFTYSQSQCTIQHRLIDVNALEYATSEIKGILTSVKAIETRMAELYSPYTIARSGEFYFKGGGFETPKAWTTNGAFSVAFTMCVDVANIPVSPTEWIGTTINVAAGRGMLLSYDKSYIRIYLIWTDSAGNRQMLSKPVRNSSFYDGKPHKWFYIFTGSKVILNIDNTYKLEYDIEDCSEIQHTSGLNFFYETIQIVSRVKAFNFDMSANDAPYTIEDYMAGKEETPLIDTILSLDNAISGTQVFDKSGNKNHANVSGEVLCCKVNNLACCSDLGAFSWADTATTQKFGNSDFAIPANSKVVAYAKSSIDVSVKFKCGAHPQEEVALSANTLTEIGTFLNASQGAFIITPTSRITGKIEVYLTMERF